MSRESLGWEAARSRYMGRLEALDVVLQRVAQVARHEPKVLNAAQRAELGGLQSQIARQLEKLHANAFHIAIVGLEKAGKSTFLNAWLRHDLLPNEEERCTYTTTELRSASSEAEQRVVVEFLSSEEFAQTRQGYEAVAARGDGREAANARKDLEEIQQHRATIEANLGQPDKVIRFQQIEEIRDELWGYIADPGAARSIRAVTIYSHLLLGERGFIFHDVPGYNSPITLHKEMARAELARADVIIFLTNLSDKVSLVESELQMLDVADREDPLVKASDKMFVFLNKADMCGDHEAFTRRYERAINEWCRTHGKCLPERVIPGSAGAHLMAQSSHVRPDTRTMLASAQESLTRVEPPFGDGMGHLQDEIERYIQHDRVRVLGARCDRLLSDGVALARHVLGYLTDHFPQSAQELEAEQQARYMDRFDDWFEETWDAFQKRFETYWHTRVEPRDDPDDPAGRHEQFEQLRRSYETIVEQLKAEYFIPEPEIRRQYQLATDGFAQPMQANMDVRKHLILLKIKPGLDKLATHLAGALIAITQELQQEVREAFFGLDEVADQITPASTLQAYHEQLTHGLSTLFLRYARPATSIFLKTPRGTPDRLQNMLAFYSNEIELLRLFYSGPAEKKRLRRFLETGSWALPEDEASDDAAPLKRGERPRRGAQSEAASDGPTSMLDAILSQAPTLPTANSLGGVVEEITEDCEAFADYLVHAIYHASGLEEYCLEELRRLRQHLRSQEAQRNVRRLLTRAYTRNDARLRASIGEDLMDMEHLRQVLASKEALAEAVATLPA